MASDRIGAALEQKRSIAVDVRAGGTKETGAVSEIGASVTRQYAYHNRQGAEVSERKPTPVTALVIAFVVMLIAVIMMVNYEQKNHIRDLQRRVGQLESERR